MKTLYILTSCIMLPFLPFIGCAGTGAAIAAFQNQPKTQQIEAGLITAAASLYGQPELAFLAGPAVSGLTIATDAVTGTPNPTAVSPTNIASAAQAITTAITHAVPTPAAKAVAAKASNAYTALMTLPGITPSPTTANAALAVIAGAITNGVIAASTAMTKRSMIDFVRPSDYAITPKQARILDRMHANSQEAIRVARSTVADPFAPLSTREHDLRCALLPWGFKP